MSPRRRRTQLPTRREWARQVLEQDAVLGAMALEIIERLDLVWQRARGAVEYALDPASSGGMLHVQVSDRTPSTERAIEWLDQAAADLDVMLGRGRRCDVCDRPEPSRLVRR